MSERKVVMYLTGWCPYCTRARQLLETKGVDFAAHYRLPQTDFGNFNVESLGTITGSVWNDVNADGFRA